MKNRKDMEFDRICSFCGMLCILSVMVYRGFIIKDYASKWLDEDQALMWCGTAMAARFQLAEPHFLGQAYGSMLESVAAVPLYWIGIPLQICMPIASFFLWYAPFLYCTVKLWKKHRFTALAVQISSLACRWDYDILTNIPRSFISGFIFAFLGVVLLNEADKKWKVFFAPILCTYAYINTETTIAVIALGILHAVLYNYGCIRKSWKQLFAGSIAAEIIYIYCSQIFYRLNPEYILHSAGNTFSLSKDVFMQNMDCLGELLCSFSFIETGRMPVVFMAVLLAGISLTVLSGEWKMLLVEICAVSGSLLFLAIPKTRDYLDSLLFSQVRMFCSICNIVGDVFLRQTHLFWKGMES